MEKTLKISKDFSPTPGARYRTDGKFSGQEFYETVLKRCFEEILKLKYKLKIILDGTHGYATSFLDEAFGTLAKDFGVDVVKNNVVFISEEEPYLVNEINEYITNAHS
ncbi:STAS-like domain-containing protein [Emticicia sp. W12TSBA100-4]|uniref:STAS-like domain-containing protein n=1 Tax=Emticicia sp. W12TSBA100-4 TaxID=3160965 RepID=UPI00330581F7